jgi:putative inorganic carbon (HCO3(-)) transporter
MRDALIFIVVFGSVPFIFKRPAIGVMIFAWLSLMNPHRLTYGSAHDFPFAAVVCSVVLLSLLISKEPKSLPLTPVTVTLLVFAAWMTLSSFFALEPDLVWREWSRVMKTYAMIFVSMVALRSERDIKQMVWVVGLSIGFYGVKGGVFTILSGGSSHVFGPDDSYIADNNALALALITVTPLLWYQTMQATHKYLKLAMYAVVALTVVAAAGSYSRGAVIAGAAMLGFLWLKSRTKVRTGLALLLVAPMIYMVMPAQWFGRMETIDNYAVDASALGRINAWGFALRIAKDNLLGGGYNVFSPRMFTLFAPDPFNHHAAHSIYFQVLGEHGFFGLLLFILFMVFVWRCGTRIIRTCKNQPELKWASDLASMCQVSLIGYLVGGSFLTMAYYDLVYYIAAILVVLERFLLPEKKLRPAVAALTPYRSREQG